MIYIVFLYQVFENGRYEDDVTIYFNLAQATKGIGHDQKKLLARVSDSDTTNRNIRPALNKTIFKKKRFLWTARLGL